MEEAVKDILYIMHDEVDSVAMFFKEMSPLRVVLLSLWLSNPREC